MARCRICRTKFNTITNTHLHNKHGLTVKEYSDSFGHYEGVGFPRAIYQFSKNDPRYIKWRRNLCKRPAPWNKGQTKDTNSSVAKISETFKKNKIDNFLLWRASARKRKLIPSGYPPFKRNPKLAFLIGLILGDGHIGIFPRTESLIVSLGCDKPLLWKYTSEVIKQVFNKKPYVKKQKNSNCMRIRIYQNQISKRLEIPIGNRKEQKIMLPKWIVFNKRFLVACLKGLFEAEGSLCIHAPTYTYNFSFSNKNQSLLSEVESVLRLLGFHPERRLDAVRLRKKQEVFALKDMIAFRIYPL